MFGRREAKACPECGLALVGVEKLSPSHEAAELDPEEPPQPHMVPLPWLYLGRGRGVLLALAAIGIALYFFPFAHETAPNLATYSGFATALKKGWLGAPLVAWFVMIPLVLTRRSIYRMRGSRLAVGFLGFVSLLTVFLRVIQPPVAAGNIVVRVEWGVGLWATGALALVVLIAAFRYGGPLDDVPTKQPRRGNETLH